MYGQSVPSLARLITHPGPIYLEDEHPIYLMGCFYGLDYQSEVRKVLQRLSSEESSELSSAN